MKQKIMGGSGQLNHMHHLHMVKLIIMTATHINFNQSAFQLLLSQSSL